MHRGWSTIRCSDKIPRVYELSKRILTEVNGEGAPLHGRRVKVPVVDVQVPRADCLRSQTVEQGNFGSAGHANCKQNQSSLRSVIQSFR